MSTLAIEGMARVIAVAIEEARTLDEERVREIIREELAVHAPAAAGWMTPPRAAKATGVGVKRVRALMAAGQVRTRARNIDPAHAAQIKHEVEIASLEAALRGEAQGASSAQAQAPVVDAAGWARRKLAGQKP